MQRTNELSSRYGEMTDEQLVNLQASGGLEEDASRALGRELAARGLRNERLAAFEAETRELAQRDLEYSRSRSKRQLHAALRILGRFAIFMAASGPSSIGAMYLFNVKDPALARSLADLCVNAGVFGFFVSFQFDSKRFTFKKAAVLAGIIQLVVLLGLAYLKAGISK